MIEIDERLEVDIDSVLDDITASLLDGYTWHYPVLHSVTTTA